MWPPNRTGALKLKEYKRTDLKLPATEIPKGRATVYLWFVYNAVPVCSYLIDILCTYEPVSVFALSRKICSCIYIYIIYISHMYMYRRNIGVGAQFFSGKVSWQVPTVKDMLAFKAWLCPRAPFTCNICSPFRVRPPPIRCLFFLGKSSQKWLNISCFRIFISLGFTSKRPDFIMQVGGLGFIGAALSISASRVVQSFFYWLCLGRIFFLSG